MWTISYMQISNVYLYFDPFRSRFPVGYADMLDSKCEKTPTIPTNKPLVLPISADQLEAKATQNPMDLDHRSALNSWKQWNTEEHHRAIFIKYQMKIGHVRKATIIVNKNLFHSKTYLQEWLHLVLDVPASLSKTVPKHVQVQNSGWARIIGNVNSRKVNLPSSTRA